MPLTAKVICTIKQQLDYTSTPVIALNSYWFCAFICDAGLKEETKLCLASSYICMHDLLHTVYKMYNVQKCTFNFYLQRRYSETKQNLLKVNKQTNKAAYKP